MTTRKKAAHPVRVSGRGPKTPPEAANKASRLPFPVVGVGASAGGLEACTAMLNALPSGTPIAIVVVQHLDPTHKSMLRELLSRATRMTVTQVEDGVTPEPAHVYVIPQDKDVTIEQGKLRLASRQQTGGKHLPIDRLLTSLAAHQASLAIGIILSGTGSDGTAGLRAIRSEGGLVFAQDPASAQHPGMPESAIASGFVDFVLPPAGIARELVRLVRSSTFAKRVREEREARHPDEAEDFQQILQILRAGSRIDFLLYKSNTIRRRVARRMAVRRMETLKQYAALLREDPLEVQALCQDVLIHVTSFFREPEAFEALQRRILPKLIAGKPAHEPVRVWVPGCSTGEEAYSIAITFLELLGPEHGAGRCQIFATDISSAAVDKARLGIYPEAALAGVAPERLKRFFVKTGEGYQISKQIRDMCVFARHDLGVDPPFSRLDLVSCRNVLIYLGPALQKRVLSIFHYALQPNGLLLLGKAEGVGQCASLFSLKDRKSNIYVRKPAQNVPLSDWTKKFSEEVPAVDVRAGAADRPSSLQRAVEDVVWHRHALAAIAVDADLQVVHFQGNTGAYLAPQTGAASLHLFKLVREGLALDLRSALHKAMKDGAPVRREGIRLTHAGGSTPVDLEVMPVKGPREKWPVYLILIEEARGKAPASSRRAGNRDEVGRLEHELASTREQLRSIIESQEAANEELETAKEELQSSNEELTTLNEELQNRNAELGQLADDMSNLLVGADIPIVVLRANGRILRFTPAAGRLLNLIPTDVGRPVGDIKSSVEIPDLSRLISEVMATERLLERDLEGKDGRWYSLRMRPHRNAEHRVDGALMALVDIDVMKRGLEQLRSSRDAAEAERDLSASLLDLSGALIVIRNQDGVITGFNRASQSLSGYSFAEVNGRRLWEVLTAPEEADRAKASFEALRNGVEDVHDHESTWIRKDGTRRVIAWTSLAQRDAARRLLRIISTGIDITARIQIEQELFRSQQQLRELNAGILLAQEEERKRLARELHDDVNQRMAMLSNKVSMLEQGVPRDAGKLRLELRELSATVDQLSDDLRRTAHQLHPSALEHFGLVAALDSYNRDFSRLHAIAVRFSHKGVTQSVPPDTALCLYRVAQECLHNVSKHSGATRASVVLEQKNCDIVLRVDDKGVGFDPELAAGKGALGLIGIRERVRLAGGSIVIRSRPGKGTKIEVRLPLVEANP